MTQQDTTFKNWPVLLNVAMIVIVLLGSWFATFSNPLNEKFVALERSDAAAITSLSRELRVEISAVEKSAQLALASSDKTSREINDSISRRFTQSDKRDDEVRQLLKDIATAAVTKGDLDRSLNTTRVEFVAEVKRLDALLGQLLKRLETLEARN